MELMSTSFDKFYKYVYCELDDVIPEEILGKITSAVSIQHVSLGLIYCTWLVISVIDRDLTARCVFVADCESTKPLKRELENHPQR